PSGLSGRRNFPTGGHVPEAADSTKNGDVSSSYSPKTRDIAGAQLDPRSSLTSDESASLEAVCSQAKYLEGPAAYNRCIADQRARLASAPRAPDFSRLSEPERQSIEAACSQAKYLEGPAAYNRCLQDQFARLQAAPRRPDLSR